MSFYDSVYNKIASLEDKVGRLEEILDYYRGDHNSSASYSNNGSPPHYKSAVRLSKDAQMFKQDLMENPRYNKLSRESYEHIYRRISVLEKGLNEIMRKMSFDHSYRSDYSYQNMGSDSFDGSARENRPNRRRISYDKYVEVIPNDTTSSESIEEIIYYVESSSSFSSPSSVVVEEYVPRSYTKRSIRKAPITPIDVSSSKPKPRRIVERTLPESKPRRIKKSPPQLSVYKLPKHERSEKGRKIRVAKSDSGSSVHIDKKGDYKKSKKGKRRTKVEESDSESSEPKETKKPKKGKRKIQVEKSSESGEQEEKSEVFLVKRSTESPKNPKKAKSQDKKEKYLVSRLKKVETPDDERNNSMRYRDRESSDTKTRKTSNSEKSENFSKETSKSKGIKQQKNVDGSKSDHHTNYKKKQTHKQRSGASNVARVSSASFGDPFVRTIYYEDYDSVANKTTRSESNMGHVKSSVYQMGSSIYSFDPYLKRKEKLTPKVKLSDSTSSQDSISTSHDKNKSRIHNVNENDVIVLDDSKSNTRQKFTFKQRNNSKKLADKSQLYLEGGDPNIRSLSPVAHSVYLTTVPVYQSADGTLVPLTSPNVPQSKNGQNLVIEDEVLLNVAKTLSPVVAKLINSQYLENRNNLTTHSQSLLNNSIVPSEDYLDETNISDNINEVNQVMKHNQSKHHNPLNNSNNGETNITIDLRDPSDIVIIPHNQQIYYSMEGEDNPTLQKQTSNAKKKTLRKTKTLSTVKSLLKMSGKNKNSKDSRDNKSDEHVQEKESVVQKEGSKVQKQQRESQVSPLSQRSSVFRILQERAGVDQNQIQKTQTNQNQQKDSQVSLSQEVDQFSLNQEVDQMSQNQQASQMSLNQQQVPQLSQNQQQVSLGSPRQQRGSQIDLSQQRGSLINQRSKRGSQGSQMQQQGSQINRQKRGSKANQKRQRGSQINQRQQRGSQVGQVQQQGSQIDQIQKLGSQVNLMKKFGSRVSRKQKSSIVRTDSKVDNTLPASEFPQSPSKRMSRAQSSQPKKSILNKLRRHKKPVSRTESTTSVGEKSPEEPAMTSILSKIKRGDRSSKVIKPQESLEEVEPPEKEQKPLSRIENLPKSSEVRKQSQISSPQYFDQIPAISVKPKVEDKDFIQNQNQEIKNQSNVINPRLDSLRSTRFDSPRSTRFDSPLYNPGTSKNTESDIYRGSQEYLKNIRSVSDYGAQQNIHSSSDNVLENIAISSPESMQNEADNFEMGGDINNTNFIGEGNPNNYGPTMNVLDDSPLRRSSVKPRSVQENSPLRLSSIKPRSFLEERTPRQSSIKPRTMEEIQQKPIFPMQYCVHFSTEKHTKFESQSTLSLDEFLTSRYKIYSSEDLSLSEYAFDQNTESYRYRKIRPKDGIQFFKRNVDLPAFLEGQDAVEYYNYFVKGIHSKSKCCTKTGKVSKSEQLISDSSYSVDWHKIANEIKQQK